MKATAFAVAALFLTLLVPLTVQAHGWHRTHGGPSGKHQTHNQRPPVVSPVPMPTTTVPVPPVESMNERTLTMYVTGYSYWDNTPAGSAEISHPVIHQKAGGTGTFADPITVAVGHSISGGTDTLDYAAGTRFYIPNLRKYFIVEDSCGDGSKPQNGPCHTGYKGNPWIDVYVGKGSSNSAANKCMNQITDLHTVIINPKATYPVVVGDIADTCQQFGE